MGYALLSEKVEVNVIVVTFDECRDISILS